jgi:hypothetical protein
MPTARDIADQLSSLSRDARKAGLDTVAYLIEMAREEAEQEAGKRTLRSE